MRQGVVIVQGTTCSVIQGSYVAQIEPLFTTCTILSKALFSSKEVIKGQALSKVEMRMNNSIRSFDPYRTENENSLVVYLNPLRKLCTHSSYVALKSLHDDKSSSCKAHN